MCCCPRALPTLLLQVNLMLMLFAGAALVMAARLKWDPTAYIPVRELFPLEYRVLAVALLAAALLFLLLAHLALFALRCRRPRLRRALLITYALCTLTLLVWEVGGSVWVGLRVKRWLASPEAADLQHAAQLSEHLQPLLEHLAYFHPLPQKVKDIIKEAEKDAPRNGYVCAAAAALLLLLQLAGFGLAVAAAATPPRPRPVYTAVDTGTTTTPISVRKGDYGRASPRAVYKQGRLMIV